jgi:hypothetical protein
LGLGQIAIHEEDNYCADLWEHHDISHLFNADGSEKDSSSSSKFYKRSSYSIIWLPALTAASVASSSSFSSSSSS